MLIKLMLGMVCASWQATVVSSKSDSYGNNRTCGSNESCAEIDLALPPSWLERNCQCDEQCRIFGDCCQDSPHYDIEEQYIKAASFSCVELRKFRSSYMSTSCPSDWKESKIRAACENFKFKDHSDPIADCPVTDLSTGVTYRNLFCATCHGSTKFETWNPQIECPGLPSNLKFTIDTITPIIYFNESQQIWGIDLDDRFNPCFVDPVIPQNYSYMIRECVPNVVQTCPKNWTNFEVRKRCGTYTTIVNNLGKFYRNPHCGVCNYVPLHQLLCVEPITDKNAGLDLEKHFSQIVFSMLFDLRDGPPGKKQPCKNDQLYDPFFKRCRNLLTEFGQLKMSAPVLDIKSSNISNETNIHKNYYLKSNCKKYHLDKQEYQVNGDTVFVSNYQRIFVEGEFKIIEDEKLEICVGEYLSRYVNKFHKYMGFITFIGLSVSIIFLLLHLTVFSLVEDLWNLPGKNMASFCIALLIAYVSFIIGRFITGPLCFVISFITLYAFLATFFWMLTMAFDVWRALHKSTTQLRVSTGKQWHKFIMYSFFSWLLPAIITMIALWMESSPSVGIDWRPGFVSNSCWFGNSKSLLILFAIPLAIIMILNIIMFASCAHMIYSTASAIRDLGGASIKRDFRLYLRLTILMGLTWAFGLIAGILDIDFFWYLFIILNTLQGLFIFLSFTYKHNVLRGIKLCGRKKPKVKLADSPWLKDSTIKKHQVESIKVMDTIV